MMVMMKKREHKMTLYLGVVLLPLINCPSSWKIKWLHLLPSLFHIPPVTLKPLNQRIGKFPLLLG
jgi:hypothetical protein